MSSGVDCGRFGIGTDLATSSRRVFRRSCVRCFCTFFFKAFFCCGVRPFVVDGVGCFGLSASATGSVAWSVSFELWVVATFVTVTSDVAVVHPALSDVTGGREVELVLPPRFSASRGGDRVVRFASAAAACPRVAKAISSSMRSRGSWSGSS